MQQESLTIALLQRSLIDGNVEVNLRAFETMIGQLPAGVDVIMLPETFTTGFSAAFALHLESHLGRSVQWMQMHARERNALVCGTVAVSEGNQRFNRFYFAYPDGQVEWYDKRHLFAYAGEDAQFTPGRVQKIFTYLGWRICPQVCYDIRFPEWSRNFGQYDLLLYPASFPAARDYAWRTLLAARAIENQAYTAGCNRVGNDGLGASYRGSSQIIAPSGRILHQLDPNATGAVIGECSMEFLQAHRKKYPFLRDADGFEFTESR